MPKHIDNFQKEIESRILSTNYLNRAIKASDRKKWWMIKIVNNVSLISKNLENVIRFEDQSKKLTWLQNS